MKDVQQFGIRVTGSIRIVEISVLIFVKRKKPVRFDFLIYHVLSFDILSFVISIFIIGGTKFTICRHFSIFTTKYISFLLYFEKKGLIVKSNRTTIFDIHCTQAIQHKQRNLSSMLSRQGRSERSCYTSFSNKCA